MSCKGCNELKVGKVLFTKDGRLTGNAVIGDSFHSRIIDETIYACLTDFGNIIELSENQIYNQFYVEESNYDGKDLTNRSMSQISKISNNTQTFNKDSEVSQKLYRDVSPYDNVPDL